MGSYILRTPLLLVLGLAAFCPIFASADGFLPPPPGPGAPILLQITAVPTPTNNTTPAYSFTSTGDGTLSMSGAGCLTGATTAVTGPNTITFSMLAEGTYNCSITVTDSSEHTSAPLSIPTFVVDTTPPVITLTGSALMTLTVGDAFTDLLATATDNVDGDISSHIIVGGDTVNTSAAGTYTITYNVSDAAGNVAIEVTRTVAVDAPDPPPESAPSGGGGGGGNGPIAGSFGVVNVNPAPPPPAVPPPVTPPPSAPTPLPASEISSDSAPAAGTVTADNTSAPAPVPRESQKTSPVAPVSPSSSTQAQTAAAASAGGLFWDYWLEILLLILLLSGVTWWVLDSYNFEQKF